MMIFRLICDCLLLLFCRSTEDLSASSPEQSGLDSDSELAHSFDIVADMDFGKGRQIRARKINVFTECNVTKAVA